MSQENALKMLKAFYAEGIDMTSAEATLWFRDNLTNIGYIRPTSVLEKSGAYLPRLAPGGIYFYGYKPKGSLDLPFFDRFPLTLVLQREKGGFLGLNFHYLHPMERADFFNDLSKYINDPKYDTNPGAKMAVTYSVMKKSKIGYYRPCIKRYYYSHIVSKVTAVPPVYWKFMLFLSIDRFAKMVRDQVWKESRRMI